MKKIFLLSLILMISQINLIQTAESETQSFQHKETIESILQFSKEKKQQLIQFIESRLKKMQKGFESKLDDILDTIDDLNNYSILFGDTGKSYVVLSNKNELNNLLLQLK